MSYILIFILGLFVGCIAGVFMAAMCTASKLGEESVEAAIPAFWIEHKIHLPVTGELQTIYYSSCCHARSKGKTNYCPNCGKKMEVSAHDV